MNAHSRILVAGIGSDHGDDRAGWLVAEELRRAFCSHSAVTIRRATVPMDLIDWLDEIQDLHVCDAYMSPSPENRLRRFTWINDGLAEVSDGSGASVKSVEVRQGFGSHGFGLIDVLRLAAVMGRLPENVTVWGIPLICAETVGEMSAITEAAVEAAVRMIGAELRLCMPRQQIFGPEASGHEG